MLFMPWNSTGRNKSFHFDICVQVFVHGYSLKANLVVVVVPDPDTVVGWCAKAGIKGTYEEICSNTQAGELILKNMNAIGKKNGLHSFEMVSS